MQYSHCDLGHGHVYAAGRSCQSKDFSATFSGFEELGEINAETGAIFSPGTATLDLDIDRKAGTITFKLKYSGLTSAVTQAHIHFGKEHVAGGIMVFFCTNLGNGPMGTKPCPTPSGKVTGTITSASVVGITTQNVPVGDFSALVAALVSNTAYANIHTVNFPAGEIRGQILKSDSQE